MVLVVGGQCKIIRAMAAFHAQGQRLARDRLLQTSTVDPNVRRDQLIIVPLLVTVLTRYGADAVDLHVRVHRVQRK